MPAGPESVGELVRVLVNLQALDQQNRHCFAASAATQPHLAVGELPRKVQMPSVSRRLVDHVKTARAPGRCPRECQPNPHFAR
jgi:hypothetical protein